MSSVSTKTGDQGTTSLMFGRRVSKASPQTSAYGAVDEFTSTLSLARSFAQSKADSEFLLTLQKSIVMLMTELATHFEDFNKLAEHGIPVLGEDDLKFVEENVVAIEASGVKFKGWTHSDENPYQATLGLARAQCRRAEREVIKLNEAGLLRRDFSLKFLNRLSDLLWLLSVK